MRLLRAAAPEERSQWNGLCALPILPYSRGAHSGMDSDAFAEQCERRLDDDLRQLPGITRASRAGGRGIGDARTASEPLIQSILAGITLRGASII